MSVLLFSDFFHFSHMHAFNALISMCIVSDAQHIQTVENVVQTSFGGATLQHFAHSTCLCLHVQPLQYKMWILHVWKGLFIKYLYTFYVPVWTCSNNQSNQINRSQQLCVITFISEAFCQAASCLSTAGHYAMLFGLSNKQVISVTTFIADQTHCGEFLKSVPCWYAGGREDCNTCSELLGFYVLL